jgi:CubicO group peptidase (beta-lactamase class C family)
LTDAPASSAISGRVDPRFDAVRDAFAESFRSRGELGAGVSVVVDGRPVVELWGGFVDRERTRPWASNTLVNVWSTTKGWTSVCLHRLVEAGAIDLDAPVARYWPEFRAEQVRVHMLLDHTAGLPAVRETLPPEALFDWKAMTTALAATDPWWPPGSKHGYHPVTFGWLVGELIRRVTGVMPGRWFRENVAGPLALDAHIGLAEEDDARVADIRPMPRKLEGPPTLLEQVMSDPTSMTARAFTNPISMVLPGTVRSRAWRGAELPAVNGHATAAAIARLYGALARGGELDGVRVLGREAIARAATERVHGPDAVLGVPTRFGLGFMLPQDGDESYGPNRECFGHTGAGGSIGFADPVANVGFGYVTNRMGTAILIDPRTRALIDAVYTSL